MRAPFPYHGMKLEAAPLIEQLMGPITNLVIPFAGGLGELFGRSCPAAVETVNDADGLLVNAWRSIKHSPDETADLCDVPVHEVTLHAAQKMLIARAPDLVELLRSSPTAHDPELGALWVWGKSCWLGGGWCRESRSGGPTSPNSRPQLTGNGNGVVNVVKPHSPNRRPALIGRAGTPHFGHGVARPLRPRSKPQLSGGAGRPSKGSGVHARQHRERLLELMREIAVRLRFVRVTCGDFRRVLTPAVTTSQGPTGISFDPPYTIAMRHPGIYREDDPGIAEAARESAAELGENPQLKIVIHGKRDEHAALEALGWSRHVWRDRDGETIWASPGCHAAAVAKDTQLQLTIGVDHG